MPLAERTRRRAAISLTPLIDVVFILLVFFMLASRFLDWRTIRLTGAPQPPQVTAQPAGSGGFEGAMLVSIRAGDVRLGGVALPEDALAERLSARRAEKPDQRILVQPAPGVPVQRLVDVLDRLEAAGIRDLALVPDGPGGL